MKYEDFKTGMVLVGKAGKKSTVLLDTKTGDIVAGETWYPLASMFTLDGNIDIGYCKEVLQPQCNMDYADRVGESIWKYDEPVEEMTLAEVCKELGRKIKIIEG